MEHEWQQVSRRRRRRQFSSSSLHSQSKAVPKVDEEVGAPLAEVSTAKQLQIVQRVRAIANESLRDSALLKDALRAIVKQFHLTEACTSLDKDAEDERLVVVGYGLGSFCASSNAVHQLGFLVALKQALDNGWRLTADAKDAAKPDGIQPAVELFDPVMNKSDAVIAEQLGMTVIQENEHGRRKVVCNTVFFMPHCAKVLYENVLACNWGLAVKQLVIIGNSFSAYGDRVLAAEERRELLLEKVVPYLEEVPLPCGVAKQHENFACYEAAFNDLSVHSFPSELLNSALANDLDLIARMAAVASSVDSKELEA
uniref:SRR1-like domain-containing protein n=1 Tax=Peronospora matthiolae TaxID=2874970 RepID=A0AAV1TZX1_9STRA